MWILWVELHFLAVNNKTLSIQWIKNTRNTIMALCHICVVFNWTGQLWSAHPLGFNKAFFYARIHPPGWNSVISIIFFDGLKKLNLRRDYYYCLICESFLTRAYLNIDSSAYIFFLRCLFSKWLLWRNVCLYSFDEKCLRWITVHCRTEVSRRPLLRTWGWLLLLQRSRRMTLLCALNGGLSVEGHQYEKTKW